MHKHEISGLRRVDLIKDLNLDLQTVLEICQELKVNKNILRYYKQFHANRYLNIDDIGIYPENTTQENLQKIDI